jgi:hypothetical protein
LGIAIFGPIYAVLVSTFDPERGLKIGDDFLAFCGKPLKLVFYTRRACALKKNALAHDM